MLCAPGGNAWAVDPCGREKRWRATAFQDAGAFTGRRDGAQRRGMRLPAGALRGRRVAGGSEKGKVAMGKCGAVATLHNLGFIGKIKMAENHAASLGPRPENV